MILENVRHYCQMNHFSIPELEKAVGIGTGTIYKWGKCSPSVDKLKLVADYFGVTVDEFLKPTEKREGR